MGKNIRDYSERKWSIYTWYIIHTICLYAMNNEKHFSSKFKKYKTFFNTLQKGVPCPECEDHFGKYLQDHPFTKETNMHEWAVNFHNSVNKRLNKNQYSVKDAKNFYMVGDDLNVEWLFYYYMVRVYANVAYTNKTIDRFCLLLDAMRGVMPDSAVKTNLPKAKNFKDKNTYIKNYLKVLRNMSEKSVSVSKFGLASS
jgi:hypothetical protein